MSKNGKIIIIGGGASGLAAALAAAKECGGRCVTVLERLDRVGKKLLATGNGRCNLTNPKRRAGTLSQCGYGPFGGYIGANPSGRVLDFFGEMGLLCDTQADGRVYPYCYRHLWCWMYCVRHWSVQAWMWRAAARWRRWKKGPAVFRCVRGTAGPFRPRVWFWLRAVRPGRSSARMVPLLLWRACWATVWRSRIHALFRCGAQDSVGLKGVRANCALSLYLDGRCAGTERGEVQFARIRPLRNPGHAGFVPAGPGVKKAGTSVDFFPEMAFPVLRGMLEQRCASGMFASLETLLLGLVAKKLGHAILKSCGLQPLSRAPGSLSRREVNALAGALKNWRFAVEGTLPWTQAQVTGGGVPLAEVKTEGCASLRCPGLYLSGEVLDAAGDCGGFNLQWAWATGIADRPGRGAGAVKKQNTRG